MADVAETIDESGRRIGHHAWIEMRLFETVGAWVASVSEPEVKALLAAQSHHHAWHAELWHGLLPGLPHLPAADLVAPADADAEVIASLDDLAEHDLGPGADRTGARLVALYRVALPHLIAGYTDHLARATVVTDGPTIRALRLALADVEHDRQAGDDLIGSLVAVPPDGEPTAR
jgi:hypothetical protein